MIRSESIVSTHELFATLVSRYSILYQAALIHKLHVSHNDLEERNIVISSDKSLRIIDFERSDCNHVCTISNCRELSTLANSLGVNVNQVTQPQLLFFLLWHHWLSCIVFPLVWLLSFII